MRPRFILSAVLFVCSACTAVPSTPVESLDRDTGVTVTTPAEPFLFQNAEQRRQAGQPGYITLVGVDVNRNSHHELLLLAYYWADTLPPGQSFEPPMLRIVADDQVVELAPEPGPASEFGMVTLPHQPPKGFALAPVVYRCEMAALSLLASASRLSIQTGTDEARWPRYEVWKDGRSALRQMIERLRP